MALKIFGHPGCTTVKRSVDWAQENGLDPEYAHFRKVENLMSQIEAWVAKAGMDAVFNEKSRTFKTMDEDARSSVTADDQARIRAMADDPRLIKRPVATDGKSVVTGFDADQWRETFF